MAMLGNALMEGIGLKKKSVQKIVFDEDELEKEDAIARDKGLIADIVLVYPIETDETLQEKMAKATKKACTPCGRCWDKMGGVETIEEVQKDIDELKERQERRAAAIVKLKQAGLTVIKSRDELGKNMYVKISGSLKRIETEAQRQGIEMLVDPDVAKSEGDAPGQNLLEKAATGLLSKVYELIFGADSKRVYRDFTREERGDFDRSGLKRGRLFSDLERTRLLYAIIEGPEDMKGGGAQLDLDLMVSQKVWSEYLTLHSEGQKFLRAEWGAMAEICCFTNARLRLFANDFLCVVLWLMLLGFYVWYQGTASTTDPTEPDLAVGFTFIICILTACFLGMLLQPLDDVRDYFGEKIAFYFAWMEHFSRYLFFLSGLAVFFLVVIEASGGASAYGTSSDAVASAASLLYCLVVAVWCTLFQEGWKRKNAVLAHTWDVTDFEEEEDPRPEFLSNYVRGRWRHRDEDHIFSGCADMICCRGQMVEKKGFFTGDGRFIESTNPHAETHKIFPTFYRLKTKILMAIPMLGFILCVMFIGAASILVLKMAVGIQVIGGGNAALGQLPVLLSTLWITIMNMVYQKFAKFFNDFENYRTETEYNDNLILKTIIFQFVNSYITLFYTAFVKSLEFPMGALFDMRSNVTGDPYHDMCGRTPSWAEFEENPMAWQHAISSPSCNLSSPIEEDCPRVFVQRDCFGDVRLLLLSYTLLKPIYELPLQIAPRLWAKIVGQLMYLRKIAKMTTEAASSLTKTGASVKEVKVVMEKDSKLISKNGSASPESEDEIRSEFHNSIALQKAQSEYPGTFAEYNPKVIQFGYIAMFSSAFPLAAVCAAVGNFIEIRIDSFKLVTLSRRPRYAGAEDIGSWQSVLSTISWIALPVNVAILVLSWNYRNDFIIPMLATSDVCTNATDTSWTNAMGVTETIPAHLLISHHAEYDGQTYSFLSGCDEVIRDCFADIGSEPWLPAWKYAPNAKISLDYVKYGLCDPESELYNPMHCESCKHWNNDVWRAQLLSALIIEHLLLLLKILLGYLIPDKPRWVVDATARKEFQLEMRETKKRRASSVYQSGGTDPEEKKKEIERIAMNINKSDDQEDNANSLSESVTRNSAVFSAAV